MSAIVGYGVKFYHGTAGAAAATEITGVQDVTPPETTATTKKVKYHNIANDTAETLVSPIKETGGLTVSFIYAKAAYATLAAMVGTTISFKLEYSDAATDAGDCVVKSCTKTAPIEDEMTMTIVLEATGAITFTPGA